MSIQQMFFRGLTSLATKWDYVGQVGDTTTTTDSNDLAHTHLIPGGTTVPYGRVLILSVAGGVPSGVVDTRGNTWVKLGNASGFSPTRVSLFYTVVSTSLFGGDAITVLFGDDGAGTNYRLVTVAEYSIPLNYTVQAAGTTVYDHTTAGDIVSANVPSIVDEALFIRAAVGNVTTGSITQTSGFTALDDKSYNGLRLYTEAKTNVGSVASDPTAPTGNYNTLYAALKAVARSAPGVTPTPSPSTFIPTGFVGNPTLFVNHYEAGTGSVNFFGESEFTLTTQNAVPANSTIVIVGICIDSGSTSIQQAGSITGYTNNATGTLTGMRYTVLSKYTATYIPAGTTLTYLVNGVGVPATAFTNVLGYSFPASSGYKLQYVDTVMESVGTVISSTDQTPSATDAERVYFSAMATINDEVTFATSGETTTEDESMIYLGRWQNSSNKARASYARGKIGETVTSSLGSDAAFDANRKGMRVIPEFKVVAAPAITPTPTPTMTPTMSVSASAVTPTPTPTVTPTISVTPTVSASAPPTATPTPTVTPTITVTPSGTPAATPTPTPSSSAILTGTQYAYYIYDANRSNNTTVGKVGVMDLANNSIVTTIDVGINPTQIVVDSYLMRGYVYNSTGNTISVINLYNNTVIDTVSLGTFAFANSFVMSEDHTRLYFLANISGATNEWLCNLDTSTNIPAALSNGNFGTDANNIIPRGGFVYGVRNHVPDIAKYDVSTNTVSQFSNLAATAISVSRDGTKVYAQVGSDIKELNSTTGSVLSTTTGGTIGSELNGKLYGIRNDVGTGKAYVVVTTIGGSKTEYQLADTGDAGDERMITFSFSPDLSTIYALGDRNAFGHFDMWEYNVYTNTNTLLLQLSNNDLHIPKGMGILEMGVAPTPTPTPTPSSTGTPTPTPTISVTPTTTVTPTISVTPTVTPSSVPPTPSATATVTPTPTPSPTVTPSASAASMVSPSTYSPYSWWDVSDLSTMFQSIDSATTAAAVNSPVGWINDKSGNGHHLQAPSTGARPILRQSGSLYYLEFDGTDDQLYDAGSNYDYDFIGLHGTAKSASLITGARVTNSTYYSPRGIIGTGQFNGTNYGWLQWHGDEYGVMKTGFNVNAANSNYQFSYATALSTDFVNSVYRSVGSEWPSSVPSVYKLTINSTQQATMNFPNSGSNNTGRILRVGCSGIQGDFMGGRWYGSIIWNRELTSTEKTNMQNWMKAKSGVA